MIRLSVNVNKIATLRNARGGNVPNLLRVSKDVLRFGAAGLTVHPRPDGRHIRREDVEALYGLVSECRAKGSEVEFNVEGYPDERFLGLLQSHPPQQATLVPDSPEVLTSHAGWQISSHRSHLQEVLLQLRESGIRSSLFVEAEVSAVEEAKAVGADCVELYTGTYAKEMSKIEEAETELSEEAPSCTGLDLKSVEERALAPYLRAARRAKQLGLRVHAGHDLNLHNISAFAAAVPCVEEVSVGHALVCESLYYGLQNVVGMYLERIERAARGY